MTNRADAEYGSPILQAEQITIEMFGEADYKEWPFKKTCEALCALHSRVEAAEQCARNATENRRIATDMVKESVEAARQQGRDEGLTVAMKVCQAEGQHPSIGCSSPSAVAYGLTGRIRALIGQPAPDTCDFCGKPFESGQKTTTDDYARKFHAGCQPAQEANLARCPRCDSPSPERHPAVQFGGEVQICPHPWHKPAQKGKS